MGLTKQQALDMLESDDLVVLGEDVFAEEAQLRVGVSLSPV